MTEKELISGENSTDSTDSTEESDKVRQLNTERILDDFNDYANRPAKSMDRADRYIHDIFHIVMAVASAGGYLFLYLIYHFYRFYRSEKKDSWFTEYELEEVEEEE